MYKTDFSFELISVTVYRYTSRCSVIFVRRVLVSLEENQEENIDDHDDKETNVKIIQKEIRFILEKLKEAFKKFDDNDTF